MFVLSIFLFVIFSLNETTIPLCNTNVIQLKILCNLNDLPLYRNCNLNESNL